MRGPDFGLSKWDFGPQRRRFKTQKLRFYFAIFLHPMKINALKTPDFGIKIFDIIAFTSFALHFPRNRLANVKSRRTSDRETRF
jgi:hypothetical protein